jgi:hypothetical protein
MKSSDRDATDETLTPSQAGVAGTMASTVAGEAPRSVAPGYQFGELLGRGGMGEVVLARDIKIERDVAVKRMRATTPTADAIARFLREAKIQARLEHPAIVPVYELGTHADGQPYFTMKRLSGTTLAEVLAKGESLQRMLRAFVDVCLAIEFAHARGVIHRDLKPANVMLGDYGEVYVLDWGVARMVGDRDLDAQATSDSLDGETQLGAILGTPGYMSPEQVRGARVTPATDVYALGSILFEILAGEPAHPRGQAALQTTLGPVQSPAKRAPSRAIAPELDAACVDALANAATDRPSARQLADRVQAYLDGDRDLERRRALADAELATARAAIDSGDLARRAEAMRAAGRALALDPSSTAAAQLVSGLMLEPPKTLPPALVERFDDIDWQQTRRQARLAALSLCAYALVVPIMVWMGVRDWTLVGGMLLLVGLNIAGAEVMVRRRHHSIAWALVSNALLLILLSRLASPWVIVPPLVAANAVSLTMLPSLLDRPLVVHGTFLGAFLAPFVLEWVGFWDSTWRIVGDKLEISSAALVVGDGLTVFLMIASLATLFVMPMFVRSVALLQRDGRRQLEIQAWHLEQLLPR